VPARQRLGSSRLPATTASRDRAQFLVIVQIFKPSAKPLDALRQHLGKPMRTRVGRGIDETNSPPVSSNSIL